jgi:DNA-binding transcriptional MerR regulator
MPKLHSAREAARAAGISHATLYAWIAAGKVNAPDHVTTSGVRLWTDADIARLKEVKKRIYQKGHLKPKR